MPGGPYELKGFLFFKGSTKTCLTARGNDSGRREKLITEGRESLIAGGKSLGMMKGWHPEQKCRDRPLMKWEFLAQHLVHIGRVHSVLASVITSVCLLE